MEAWASLAKGAPGGKPFELFFFNELTQAWEKKPLVNNTLDKSRTNTTTSSQSLRDFQPVEALAHTMIGSWVSFLYFMYRYVQVPGCLHILICNQPLKITFSSKNIIGMGRILG